MIAAWPTPDGETWQGIGAELDRIGQLAQGRLNSDPPIERSLQQAGDHPGADCAYLLQRCGDGAQTSNSHEWCASGIVVVRERFAEPEA